MDAIERCIVNSKGDPDNLLSLTAPSPDNIGYSTIVSGIQKGDELLKMVNSVYEWQSEPLMYMIDGSKSLAPSPELGKLRRILALRGDTPYLGIVHSERLKIHQISLDEMSFQDTEVKIDNYVENNGAFFAKLANIRPNSSTSQSEAVSKVILKLLTKSISNILELKEVKDNDTISLVGRALFARFLADRELIPKNLKMAADASNLFDTPTNVLKTSHWIDKTFNGDFLPISDAVISRLTPDSCSELGNIMRKAEYGQLYLGWSDKIWDFLDFAHIPVGILSQVYEMYLKKHHGQKQKEQSGFYTPVNIAKFMAEISIEATLAQSKDKKPKILDPAAGAGVFLISAFQKLVQEQWKRDGKRPNTKSLRKILNNQITGFDIDEPALRFAALGLYLISIELDDDPNPTTKLKFKNLIDNVLFNFAGDKTKGESDLGSLSNLVGTEHIGKYDIVIGNPPWSSQKNSSHWTNMRRSILELIEDRGIECRTNPIPKNSSNLAFLWKAMEWAKPNGQIALNLNAGFLFKQGSSNPAMRDMLFDTLNVTVIVNGAELRKTKVMPNTSAPFCIIFAKNQIPEPNSEFRFITPRLDNDINGDGKFRIDTKNSVLVRRFVHKECPSILKILSKGSTLDYGVFSRLQLKGHPTLKSFWDNPINTDSKIKLHSGTGFKRGNPAKLDRSSVTNEKFTQFNNIPVLSNEYVSPVLINLNELCREKLGNVQEKRKIEIYQGPLLIVHQSPPAELKRFRAFVSEGNLRYNNSYVGYSAKGHPNSLQLVKFLHLIFNSKFMIWQALMTCGKFGIERTSVEKIELDNMLIPNFNKLSTSQLDTIEQFFEKLNSNQFRDSDLEELDKWVAGLYNFSERDQQIINDTVKFRLPYSENNRLAQETPLVDEIEDFCKVLKSKIQRNPCFNELNVKVERVKQFSDPPWRCINVMFSKNSTHKHKKPNDRDFEVFIKTASDTAVNPFLIPYNNTDFLVGILAQKQFWSDTEAQLLSMKISEFDFKKE